MNVPDDDSEVKSRRFTVRIRMRLKIKRKTFFTFTQDNGCGDDADNGDDDVDNIEGSGECGVDKNNFI